MAGLLCSTGTLLGRANGRDFRLLPGIAPKLHCDGMELIFYDSWYGQEEKLYATLCDVCLPIPVHHVEKNICSYLASESPEDVALGHRRFEINCQLASAMHAGKLVFHLWDGRMDMPAIERAIAQLTRLIQTAEKYGLLLTVENIVSMHTDPLSCLHLLHSRFPSLAFTYDTKMAAFHHQEERFYAAETRSLLPCIRHFHINDYQGGYMEWQRLKTLHPGEGLVNFQKLFAFIRQMEYTDDFTTEATSFDQTGTIHLDKLNNTLDTIRHLME